MAAKRLFDHLHAPPARRLPYVPALVLLALVVTASSWLPASGDLDASFGTGGKVSTIFAAGQSARLWNMALQSNGKIVAVGDTWPSGVDRNMAVARYNLSGALDRKFSGDGRKVVNIGRNDQAVGVAIHRATGRSVVAGQRCPSNWTPCDAVIMRFNIYGGLDLSFSADGKRVDDFGGGDNGFLSAAVYPDGRILAAGYRVNPLTGLSDAAVMRFTASGALDKTFSGDGKVSMPFVTGGINEANEVAIQADGKILISGFYCNAAYQDCGFGLARLNKNGSLDSTFHWDGKQALNLGGDDRSRDMVIQPDGKIILVGTHDSGTTVNMAIIRLDSSGELDPAFAGTGYKLFDFFGDADPESAFSVVVQPDGKIVVCGAVSDGSSNDFSLARFTSTGEPDTTFSGDGKASYDLGGDDRCFALSLQPTGEYLLGGSSISADVDHWVVIRVLP